MELEKDKTPVWFWVVSIFFLLWNMMGVFSFYAHTFISNEALAELPANERELYSEYPLWITVVFAIAVFTGMLGSIGLVLKKKWSKKALTISLVAIISQMMHNIFLTITIEVYGTVQALMMPSLVVLFGFLLLWFSSFGIKKDWLK